MLKAESKHLHRNASLNLKLIKSINLRSLHQKKPKAATSL